MAACRDKAAPQVPGQSQDTPVPQDGTVASRATESADAQPTMAAGDAQLIRITSFDCRKVTGFSDERLDGGIPRGEGIARWNNGGPAGAVWNAFDLHCAADINVSCTVGEVLTELRVGRALVASARHPFARRSDLQWTTVIAESKWERQLDERPPTGKYYRTGIFRVTALLTCKEPEAIAPGLASHRAVVADRAFTAGFASGE